MAYVPYPERPIQPNGFQILGQALGGAGQTLTAEEDRQQKLRAALEEMTIRRAAAEMARKKFELDQQESRAKLEQQNLENKLKQEAEARRQNFVTKLTRAGEQISPTLAEQPELARRPQAPTPEGPTAQELADLEIDSEGAAGPDRELPAQKVRPISPTQLMGEAVNREEARRPMEEYGQRWEKMDRDQMLLEGLKSGQLDLDKFGTLTKPEKPPARHLVANEEGVMTSVDPNTGLDLEGKPVRGAPHVTMGYDPISGEAVAIDTRRAFAGRPGATRGVEGVGKKTPEQARFDALPVHVQKQIENVATKTSNKQLILNQIDGFLDQYDAALEVGDNDLAIRLGLSMLKTLNSSEGSDAIGAEEAGRYGSALMFQWKNLTDPGPLIGRDLKGFKKQAAGVRDALGDGLARNEKLIESLYNKGKKNPAIGAVPTSDRGKYKGVDKERSKEYLLKAGWSGQGKATAEQRKEAKRLLAKDGYNVAD